MPPLLALLIGLIFAGVGGEFFVKGAVGIARALRVPAGIIGATVAAFATSSPELSVSVNAALAQTPQIALGDALGSNVTNIALILGLVLTFGSMASPRGENRTDLGVALAAPFITGLLLLDGELTRIESAGLLFGFLAWLAFSIRAAWSQRDATEQVLGERRSVSVGYAVGGLILLVLSGSFIVAGAKEIGAIIGWEPFIVGATLVALGTSAPELATAIISRMRGHDEVGLGTLIGSNIFNGLFIVSVAGLIYPIRVKPQEVMLGLAVGVVSMIIALPNKQDLIPRARGFLLLALYAGYVAVLAVFFRT